MKSIMEIIIRKRNPTFQFSKALSNKDIFSFVSSLFFYYLRGIFLHRLSPFKTQIIGKGVNLKHKRYLHIGKRLKLEDFVYIDALGKEGINIKDNVSVGAYTRIIVSSSLSNLGKGINIGSGVGIGEFSRIGGSGGVSIGDNTIIGQYFSCHPENHNFDDLTLDIKFQGTNRSQITIGKNCWLGSKVTIAAGVTIGNGCVIGAGSVVTKSLAENSIAAGVPAKIIRKRGENE